MTGITMVINVVSFKPIISAACIILWAFSANTNGQNPIAEKRNDINAEVSQISERGSMYLSRTPWWARKYTKRKTGCPCWFDLTNPNLENKCACCKRHNGKMGVPCGYPMHKYCQRDEKDPTNRKGCPGVI